MEPTNNAAAAAAAAAAPSSHFDNNNNNNNDENQNPTNHYNSDRPAVRQTLASLASRKEREWREVLEYRGKVMEDELLQRQRELQQLQAKYKQLKDDFKVGCEINKN